MIRDLQKTIERMSNPDAVNLGERYYVFRLAGTLEGLVMIDVQTKWVGFKNDDPRCGEIRVASIMDPSWWIRAWQSIRESFLIVNSIEEVAVLLGQGGNALIEEKVAETMFPARLKPQVYDKADSLTYISRETKPGKVFDRAPTQKVRMKVIERDKYRCQICGRRASDNVDIVLNVHHIIPWAEGGLSEQKNLITLCHTCHGGLHPHFQADLFELLPKEEKLSEEELRFDYRVSKQLYLRAWQNR